MPTGFKQMISAFEQLPEEKRRKAIDDTLRRLKEAQQHDPATMGAGGQNNGTNKPPVLSKELEEKVRCVWVTVSVQVERFGFIGFGKVT